MFNSAGATTMLGDEVNNNVMASVKDAKFSVSRKFSKTFLLMHLKC